MALNNNEIWWQNVVKDYREFLPGNFEFFKTYSFYFIIY